MSKDKKWAVRNNGQIDDKSNACCFIALHDYLHYLANKPITVNKLCNLADFPNESIMFDTAQHHDGFDTMAKILSIGVYFYIVEGDQLVERDKYNHTAKHIVNIISYFPNAAHFELLVNDQQKSKLLSNPEFVATSRKIESYINYKSPEESKIDSLFKAISQLQEDIKDSNQISIEQEISNTESQIPKKDDLSDEEAILYIQNISKIDELKIKLNLITQVQILEGELNKLINL